MLLGLIGVIAGPLAPLATAAGGVNVTTPFPTVVAEPGSTTSFNLAIAVSTAERRRPQGLGRAHRLDGSLPRWAA